MLEDVRVVADEELREVASVVAPINPVRPPMLIVATKEAAVPDVASPREKNERPSGKKTPAK